MQNHSVIHQFFWLQNIKIYIEKIFQMFWWVTSDSECRNRIFSSCSTTDNWINHKIFQEKYQTLPVLCRCWHWVMFPHLIFHLMDKISQQASSMMFVKHCHDLCPTVQPLIRNLYSPSYIIDIYTSFPSLGKNFLVA